MKMQSKKPSFDGPHSNLFKHLLFDFVIFFSFKLPTMLTPFKQHTGSSRIGYKLTESLGKYHFSLMEETSGPRAVDLF